MEDFVDVQHTAQSVVVTFTVLASAACALMVRRLLLLALVVVVAAAWPAAQKQEPAVDDVLRAVAGYLAAYEKNLAIVGQEDYLQQVTNAHRSLRSDILFMQDDLFGWVEFRDVAMSDGVPVRDREARLMALFTKPNPDRLRQAQGIVSEGARFNLDAGIRLNRTINLPLTALRFLRMADQHRSSFRLVEWDRQTDLVTLEFIEQGRPRLIGTPDQRASRGQFEIDRMSGRVVTSRLIVQSGTTVATIGVKFSHDPKIGMWLPRSMEEQYRGPFPGLIKGLAHYSQYRQFRVETQTEIDRH